MAIWTSEIRLRAAKRIGELCRTLDKAPLVTGEGSRRLSGGKSGTSKASTLAAAGLSTSTANRYEQLSGDGTAQHTADAEAAAENFLAKAAAHKEPVTMAGFHAAIRGAPAGRHST